MVIKIWKLSPIDKKHPSWKASGFKGSMIIRAETERDARDLAEKKAGTGTMVERGSKYDDTPLNPWQDTSIVRCEELKDSRYSADGPPEVLMQYPDGVIKERWK